MTAHPANDRGRAARADMEIVRSIGGIAIVSDAMTALDPTTPAAHSPNARSVSRIASEQLMKGRREVIIQHGREEYRLRVTAAGKLILTK